VTLGASANRAAHDADLEGGGAEVVHRLEPLLAPADRQQQSGGEAGRQVCLRQHQQRTQRQGQLAQRDAVGVPPELEVDRQALGDT
jgi:hypothetical protein